MDEDAKTSQAASSKFKRSIQKISAVAINIKGLILVMLIIGIAFIFQNFKVKNRFSAPVGSSPGGTSTIELEIKATSVTLCGKSFQRIDVDDQSLVTVSYSSTAVGNFSILLPEQMINTDAARPNRPVPVQATLRLSSRYPVNASVPILPHLPTLDSEPASALKPGLCDIVNQYLKTYVATSISASTPLVKVNSSGGLVSVQATQNLVQVNNVILETKPVLNSVSGIQSSDSSFVARQYKYLIITQDLYRAEADQLAAYRNSKGVATKVISISALPGYYANNPTPPQCAAPFDRECYHYWGDLIDGVSQLAVPSLLGFHQESTFNQRYTRVSYVPGLIRAYIREMKSRYPIKAVLLIGDPEQVPPIYTPKVNFSSFSQRASCDYFNWVNEAYGNDDFDGYCQGGSRFSLGTDLYYTLPSIPLPISKKVNVGEISPGLLTCEYRDRQNLPQRQMKVWCGRDEYRYWGEPEKPMEAYAWAPQYPLTRLFSDPISNGYSPSTYASIPVTDYLAVGRIVTQSRYHEGKDPAAQNYINKLIYWESHLPPFQNNSIATFGGDEWWLSENDSHHFFNHYGASSKIYTSTILLPTLNASSSFCNSSNCKYENNENILNSFATSPHTAWLINGHGGHNSVQGTIDQNNGSISKVLGFSKSFVFRDDRVAHATPYNRTGIDTLMGTSNQLVGHAIANSCDISSYLIFDYQTDLMRKIDSSIEPASFAEVLMAEPAAGAINVYMNYFVGWGYSDNTYDRWFISTVNAAHGLNEPMGTALVNLQYYILNHQRYYNHQLINRVFLGDPYASIAQP